MNPTVTIDAASPQESPNDSVPLEVYKKSLAVHEAAKVSTKAIIADSKSDNGKSSASAIRDCPCTLILSEKDLKSCNLCHSLLQPLAKLLQHHQFLTAELHSTKQKCEKLLSTAEKDAKLVKRARDHQESKNEEFEAMKLDMEILGQKLIDEIEKRAEIQDASENVSRELEELTQALFEEANTLVSKEARERHGAQEKTVVLARQLSETNTILLVEQAQVRELRQRVAQLEQINQQDSRRNSLTVPAQNLSVRVSETTPNTEELLHGMLFKHFEEFCSRAPNIKLTKIHELTYMRNALEDDVTPCLRFGGNPRTSTKKFIDAILANTCFIEEMSKDQVLELVERDAAVLKSSQEKLDKLKIEAATPSTSLFNKTMLERITTALTSPAVEPADAPGCSSCGVDQPYRYRFKISEDTQQDVWFPICLDCRARLVSVVNFYQFIRNLRQGLYTSRDLRDLYIEALSLQRKMFFTRIGAGGMRNPDMLFKGLIPVRPNSSILSSLRAPSQLPFDAPAIAEEGGIARALPAPPSGFNYTTSPDPRS